MISKHFSWHEALWLPSWGREATEADGLTTAIELNLADLFGTMEIVRRVLGDRPVSIHNAYRPPEYNRQCGGAPHSAHLDGRAADFHVEGLTCDEVRSKLEPLLVQLGVRMENNPGSNWVHIGRDQERLPRYFKA